MTEESLEEAALKALQNFGRPTVLMPMNMSHMGWSPNPEFAGTSWEDQYRMSKRERKFAQLHVFIYKLGILPGGQINNDIHELACKRLKRAKWARYQKSKKV